MTNERAIELLNRISDSQFDGEHGDERREALSMAVRALESNLVKESGGLVNDLVKDCISRKMAIDEVKRLHDVAWANWKETRISANTMIDALKDLPSAQPERKKGKWIITKTEHAWNCAEYPIEVTCSNCGYIEDYYMKDNFCPCCGTDLRGEVRANENKINNHDRER